MLSSNARQRTTRRGCHTHVTVFRHHPISHSLAFLGYATWTRSSTLTVPRSPSPHRRPTAVCRHSPLCSSLILSTAPVSHSPLGNLVAIPPP